MHEPGGRLQRAIFLTTSIASLHCVSATGASAKTAAVGMEGTVGLALFMGGILEAACAYGGCILKPVNGASIFSAG